MSRSFHTLAAAAAFAACFGGARAADLGGPAPPAPAAEAAPFFVKVGLGGLFLSEKADISVAGRPFPGANVRVKPQTTAIIEAGYNFTPNWAVSFTTGLPPLAKVNGAGLIRPLGRLANVRYGPMALTAHYHFDFGAFRPYIGAGPGFMVVPKNYDRALTNFEMRNAVGFVGQIGADYMISDRFGLFVDAKKIYLRTSAVGSLAGMPIKAKVKLDPLVLTTGFLARF